MNRKQRKQARKLGKLTKQAMWQREHATVVPKDYDSSFVIDTTPTPRQIAARKAAETRKRNREREQALHREGDRQ